MNAFIIILLIIVVPVALFLLLGLFVKKEYSIERQIIINKTKQEVFDYVRFLKNQEHYNKWVMVDPAMKKNFKGTDGTVGFVYAWDGNKKAGKGEQEIKHLRDGEGLDLELRFEKPFTGVANAFLTTTSAQTGQTVVKWGMNGSSAYPRNAMNPLVIGLLGKDLEQSLLNLKSHLEKAS
jgi:polyketide cyclase/dehydrase/lipid transport protein